MNEINYFILDADHNIIDSGLELVYTMHHFIRGQQFAALGIEPAAADYDLEIPANAATRTEGATIAYPVHQLKKIYIDETPYYLACYTLDPGSDMEVSENVN
jgi:hypothetical protein